ncbi:GNAT family N-acetyltransferase [Aliiroseovarius sp. S1339]|uniref:GNAT family N-acetyltransferase n=1 Tax=Aliiroseovarius sp. S1339 TaxID=2936990 RepID=UPI0020BF9D2C|nr:GNAT family N-acetyltransferase [Aliiroseovarius sp. S1339]MCK8464057.1 GNAT family N-acetyltransferase [Aliiroseovarius sp. S1339]
MIVRPAQTDDAVGIADVLNDLVRAGKRSNRDDPEFALNNYIARPNRIECLVADDEEGRILGFQSLKLAKIGNEYGAPAGWALIGTHISPNAARRGIDKALFAYTLRAAQKSGVPAIEAFIGATNTEGQAYYEAMGFSDYRQTDGAICKALHLR